MGGITFLKDLILSDLVNKSTVIHIHDFSQKGMNCFTITCKGEWYKNQEILSYMDRWVYSYQVYCGNNEIVAWIME